jgi:AP-3 complex subunit beta
MSTNSFAYNEQSGGGEAAELGQEATSAISSSGAFGLFSSDLKK